ncbi:NPC intracellular cholesterol transporter 1 homolog 1b-like isoform X2 [Prorops nasuta]|uniref:NPC intracellular cholesterol transporter 1 homolog 1b-like isoform X2 n=1 Tax=Prorops nasuta TaxID=863751 RepID=UPI0034CDF99F
MRQIVWIFGSIVLSSVFWRVNCDGQCIWYGECAKDKNTKLSEPCKYTDPAVELTDQKSLKTLMRRCPHFFENTSTPKTCCDPKQIAEADTQMTMAEGIFGRCSTCIKNMFRLICDITCGPEHSNYLQPTYTINSDDKEIVSKLKIFVTEQYINETFDSCKNIIHPASGNLAMDMGCGDHGASRCTAKLWYQYMGDKAGNQFTPFQMDYIYDEPGRVSWNATAKKCHEAYDKSVACSCVDCPSACPLMQLSFDLNNPYMIFNFNGYGVIAAIVILIFSILVPTLYMICKRVSWRVKFPGNCACNIPRHIESFFIVWGKAFSKRPVVALFSLSYVILALSYGIIYLTVTVNPIEIWAAPESRSRIEKDYFDSRFQPFYRTEIIYIKPVGLEEVTHNTSKGILKFGPVFNKKFLLAVYNLQEKILQLGHDTNEGLENICYAPVYDRFLGPMSVDFCTVQSIWGYFQNNLEKFNVVSNDANGFQITYLDQIYKCLQNPYNMECLAPYKGPIIPAIAIGGFLKPNQYNYDSDDYIKANGIILSFLVKNSVHSNDLKAALEWEKKFISFMKNWDTNERPEFMDVAYSAERSIEDELDRTSKAEISTMIVSYLVMFLYIAIALGKFRKDAQACFVGSKFVLGVGGIVIVIASVMCSLGIFGYAGIPTTLLTIEVIPFLVLAVGVDNIFILVQAHQRNPRRNGETIPDHIGRILGLVGPSILLTSTSEFLCFLIGAISSMPAVKTFALYASVSIVINFSLQITAFIALLSLDSSREEDNRIDVLCCIRSKAIIEQDTIGLSQLIFEKIYTPILMKKWVRAFVVIVFIGIFTTHALVAPDLIVGLDQKLSMSKDSYVLKYFEFMQDLLSMGPPVYFVLTEGLNFSDTRVQNAICGGQHCNSNSLYTKIYSAAKQSATSYLSKAASSWIDDYFDWSSISGCCKYYPDNNTFCPHYDESCKKCDISTNELVSRPDSLSFEKYISYFVSDIPDADCSKAGRPSYRDAINYYYKEDGLANVNETYFMGYHTPLKKDDDWYKAIKAVRLIADNITTTLNNANLTDIPVNVFPYSVFYVFYEQYLTIWQEALSSLGYSLLVIFLVTSVLTGFSRFSAMVVILNVCMIVVNIAGLMYWWNISLNAISLVNLIMINEVGKSF